MLSAREELLEKKRSGKDGRIDFSEVRAVGGKVKESMQDGLADEMSAFTNGSGGVLLLGVSDDGSVVGIPEGD